MDKSTDDMIKEVWTVLLGVPGTEEGGMAQDVKDTAKELKKINGKVTTNTTWRKAHNWMIGLIATGLGTAIFLMIAGV